MSSSSTPATAWTCPFCPLACDHAGVRIGAGAEPLQLTGADCARARQSLGLEAATPSLHMSFTGNPGTVGTPSGMPRRDPSRCEYAQVNSAPNRKICAE